MVGPRSCNSGQFGKLFKLNPLKLTFLWRINYYLLHIRWQPCIIKLSKLVVMQMRNYSNFVSLHFTSSSLITLIKQFKSVCLWLKPVLLFYDRSKLEKRSHFVVPKNPPYAIAWNGGGDGCGNVALNLIRKYFDESKEKEKDCFHFELIPKVI